MATAPSPAPAASDDDDPLAQAMSMLDSLNGGEEFDDFAIDSDEDEANLTDLNAYDDDDLGIDLLGGGNDAGGGGGGGGNEGSSAGAEVVGPRGTSTVAGAAPAPAAPPGAAPPSDPLSHLLRDDVVPPAAPAPERPAPSENAAPTTTTAAAVSNSARAVSNSNSGPTPTAAAAASNAGSWTSGLSMSGFATLASRAAASVQSAVENAEAVVGVGGGGGGVGGQPPLGGGGQFAAPGGIRLAQNSHAQQQQRQRQQQQQQHQQQQQQQQKEQQKIQGGGSGQGGPKGGAAGMSYQERQKILHQRFHANSNSNNAAPAGVGTTVLQQPMAKPPSSAPSPVAAPAARSVAPSASSGQLAPGRRSPPKAAPTFLEKLTSNLDTAAKTELVASALGKLLPGERVIMFLNALQDVRDSRFGQAFVGSEDVLEERGLGGILGGNGGGNDGEGNGSGAKTVWCCVMTFYRVVVFSYRASLEGKVLPEGTDDCETGKVSGGREEIIQQWINAQNVSIQFQAAHCPPADDAQPKPENQCRHHVFQMPLASIERVEKVMSSSQRKAQANAASSSGYATPGGYGYNAILPSSSAMSSSMSATMSSTASSAMSSLGSQMKPLLGGMTSAANANLLANGSGGGANPAAGADATPAGPLGIVLHGKDGGRWIRFSADSHEDARRAHEALNTYAFPGRRNLGYLFAFESRRAEVVASGRLQNPPGARGPGGGGGGAAEGAGNPIATAASPTRRRFVPLEEFGRQGVLGARGGGRPGADGSATAFPGPWAPILNANANYGLCSTYPSVLVGPRSIVGEADAPGNFGNGVGGGQSDGGLLLLRRCAAFRSEGRFPSLTWGNPDDGGSIWRSAQPKVGLQGNRSPEDERYLAAIGEEAKRANLMADARAEGGVGGGTPMTGGGGAMGAAGGGRKAPTEFLRMLCGGNNEGDLIGEGPNSGCTLKIMDMRPKSAAMGNRTQGYGYENTNNYRGSTIGFYGIGNIHAVRDAYQKVNALCLSPTTSDFQWMQLVENTGWPSMIRLILSASWQTAFHVHYNRLPVLVHCSHGWDRTSQVPALAQLLLDPHYRTREGFSALVEKDFLSFGHPFHTRCGHGEGRNDQGGGDEGQLSPIFLQFLDCVFQLVNQFPDYFEFNARYLLLLSEHVYSCRFGTLLCDSEREREVVAGIRQRTYCMWEYLDSVPELVNPAFERSATTRGVLMMPLPMLLRNVTLWTDRHSMHGAKATVPCVPPGLGSSGGRNPPAYVVRPPGERPVALHATGDADAGAALKRATDNAEMWKETALAALREVQQLKEGRVTEE